MNLQHVNAKIFVDGELTVDLEQFIEVFHRWVADQAMDEMMIDVADYRHVPQGPGVVMIGHESDYAIDLRAGRPGLLYNRKAELEGSNSDRLFHSLRSAARVCLLLQAKFDKLAFSRREFEFFFNDRALAPNTPETYEYCQAVLPDFVRQRVGAEQFDVDFDRDPRSRFAATIRLVQPIDLRKIAEA